MNESEIMSFVLLALLIFAIVFGITSFEKIEIKLKQSTADEICKQLSNDSIAVAKRGDDCDRWSNCNLKCVLPSFDSTQEIVFVSNSD